MRTQTIHGRKSGRKRGATLMDALLAIGILMGILVMMAVNDQREAQRQQDRLTAARVEILANVAKTYVGDQYDNIREDLTTATGFPGDVAAIVMTIQDLADVGYVPSGVNGGANADFYGQDYRLFMRAVLRSDPSFPQNPVTTAEIAAKNGPDANGNPTLTNGIYSSTDDEMDIEAVLISEGGTPIPLRRGPNITANSGNPTMGYIVPNAAGDLIASGNLGAFEMPLEPWTNLGSTATSGGLLTLISLSDGNNTSPNSTGGSADIRGALRRCDDLTDPTQKQTCIDDANNMYSTIVFSNITGATPDFDDYPGIEGLKKISCRENDSAGRPTGAIDENFDVIYIDCGNVIMSDNLVLQNGDLSIEQGNADIENGVLTLNGNEIGNNLIMASGESTNLALMPNTPLTEQCPLRSDGTRMSYKAQAWVSNIIEPVGRPLAGYRMTAPTIDSVSGQFQVDVISFVNEDYCQNVDVTGTILSPNNVTKNMDLSNFTSGYYDDNDGNALNNACGPVQGDAGDGDGYPDAYYLNPGQAQIQYAIYCE